MNGHTRFLDEHRMAAEPIPLSRTQTGILLKAQTIDMSRIASEPPPDQTKRKWTQEDQDEEDAEKRRKAIKELVQSWMDRLQLISVIVCASIMNSFPMNSSTTSGRKTTFFAATEAQLLGLTTPDLDNRGNLQLSEAITNATLAGALLVHVYAGMSALSSHLKVLMHGQAILSFFAAFFLIRYRLKEATRAEIKIETGQVDSPRDIPIFTSNPHLETVGWFRRPQPPIHLLENCHTLCMWLAHIGFSLALTSVVCFSWARLPLGVSIFVSVGVGACSLASVVAFIASFR
ncbi:unnamed protein product [Somion occarium]|uniref:Uncharacterized protein n=1 Tax=Somion occarium TaxID=3059160 RepID=A0ABP1DUF2_9APHY